MSLSIGCIIAPQLKCGGHGVEEGEIYYYSDGNGSENKIYKYRNRIGKDAVLSFHFFTVQCLYFAVSEL